MIAMEKTIVFHWGCAPKGDHTWWILHEYQYHTVGPEFECGDEVWVSLSVSFIVFPGTDAILLSELVLSCWIIFTIICWLILAFKRIWSYNQQRLNHLFPYSVCLGLYKWKKFWSLDWKWSASMSHWLEGYNWNSGCTNYKVCCR